MKWVFELRPVAREQNSIRLVAAHACYGLVCPRRLSESKDPGRLRDPIATLFREYEQKPQRGAKDYFGGFKIKVHIK
jgi:hypothetical protein